ncbi:MAG: spore germination protein [Syntrophomonadaceae bacterium]|jgi:spore germination protein KA|nr:spore germination protein [Syntrophomonadaceae bacterium]
MDHSYNNKFSPETVADKHKSVLLSPELKKNQEVLTQRLAGCFDFMQREFSFGSPPVKASIIFFEGLVDKRQIENSLIKSIFINCNIFFRKEQNSEPSHADLLDTLKNKVLTLAEVKTVDNYEDIILQISSGDTVLLLDNCASGLVIGTRSWAARAISMSENETTVFGPKESFTETLISNTAMLRRRLKSSSFKMERLTIGRISQTSVCFCYIENIAPPALVANVKERLSQIDIDAILDTGYLEELITEEPYSIFSQAMHTERPDRVCGNLLEGKVGIMIDGSPMVLVLPVTFPQFANAPDDYYINYIPATLLRFLRIAAFAVSLLMTAVFVSLLTYHHEMIPTPLLLTIISARQGVPFPAFVEALLLETTFELLREAGLRLPNAIGPAVSIVGALIIGEAAVQAGLVSTPMVVVIAFSGIASFVIPNYNAGIITRIMRFVFLIAAGLLGLFGIMITFILLITRMASVSFFGIPYLSPVAPFNNKQIFDILTRRPWFSNTLRPWQEGMKNQKRYEPKPAPSSKDKKGASNES